MSDLAFQCACGAVAGRLRNLSPRDGIRFVCHCDDCQVAAHLLGHPETLDAHGGTAAVLLNSSKLVIEQGVDRLAAIRVAAFKTRPVLRWHCARCRTPLFNTYDTSRRSFLSFLLNNADPHACDALLGPSTGHAWKAHARGDASGLKDANLAAILVRLVGRQISARLSGDYRNTPLFDPETGDPVVTPRAVSAAERAETEAAMARLS